MITLTTEILVKYIGASAQVCEVKLAGQKSDYIPSIGLRAGQLGAEFRRCYGETAKPRDKPSSISLPAAPSHTVQ